MAHRERLLANAVKLIEGCKILQVPVYLTEQYPRGLGTTESVVREALADTPTHEKVAFSCCAVEPLVSQLHRKGIHQVVLAGIEAHVCVLQSALDLLAADFQVHVPYDATTSRKESDWQVALKRMRTCGVIVTTTESVLFELLEVAGTPEFKQVSALIK
jgi:nicotinamidase-related amidase